MSSMDKAFYLGVLIVISFVGFSFIVLTTQNTQLGGAAPGLEARVATSTTSNLVANAATALFATTTGCTSRIITTTPSAPVRITFRDEDVPTATFGHIQAASTSVAYDSAIFGCGWWEAFSWSAQAVTLSETVAK